LFGSNGTLSDPKVKTAARSSVSSSPPMPRPQRCLLSSRLMAFPSQNYALLRKSRLVRRASRSRCGQIPSAVRSHEQNVSILCLKTSLWHDSQRAEASQDFYLSQLRRTCPFGQVLAISER